MVAHSLAGFGSLVGARYRNAQLLSDSALIHKGLMLGAVIVVEYRERKRRIIIAVSLRSIVNRHACMALLNVMQTVSANIARPLNGDLVILVVLNAVGNVGGNQIGAAAYRSAISTFARNARADCRLIGIGDVATANLRESLRRVVYPFAVSRTNLRQRYRYLGCLDGQTAVERGRPMRCIAEVC